MSYFSCGNERSGCASYRSDAAANEGSLAAAGQRTNHRSSSVPPPIQPQLRFL